MGAAAEKALRPLGTVNYRPVGWWSMMSAMVAALAIYAYLSDEVSPRKGREAKGVEARVPRESAPPAETKKMYRRVLDKGVVYPR